MSTTFRWLVTLVVAYELLAAFTNWFPTISEDMWDLDGRWLWLKWAVGGLFIVLWGHFFLRWWGPKKEPT